MEAGRSTWCALRVLGCWFLLVGSAAMAAGYRTQNFLVDADDPGLARAVGDAAERFRRDLAVHWIGHPLPDWPRPCPIRVIAGPHLAAQGVTQYDPAPVRNFVMEVVGTPQRILDSVLPHEVTHTVLATHFGRPIPRWADEGISTTVEHESERAKHEAKLREFLRSRRGIAMNRLFLLTEYPNDVLPMYAQGYSVCRFLIEQKSPRAFIGFLHDYIERPSWTENIRKHYGYESLAELQEHWLAWVSDGSGAVDRYVKSAPATGPVPGAPLPDPVSLAQANGQPLRSAAATGAGSENRPDSFYARQLNAKPSDSVPVTSGPETAATAQGSLIPPSIQQSGRYSVAQPQPEQGGPTANDGGRWIGWR